MYVDNDRQERAPMQLNKLLHDAAGLAEGASQRSMHAALAARLSAIHGAHPITAKGVAKWFARERIPSPWLMRIVALPDTNINLNDYMGDAK